MSVLIFFGLSEPNLALMQYEGHVFDQGSHVLLYTEAYTEMQKKDRGLFANVTYKSSLGQVIATKELDFSKDKSNPDFYLENKLTSGVEGVQVENGVSVMFFQKKSDAEIEKKVFERSENTVIDAGFHYFVLKHWVRLMEGEGISFSFVLPNKLKLFPVRIKKIIRPVGQDFNRVMFEIKSRSWFVGLFVPTMAIEYDRETRQLLRYSGVSNIEFKDGAKLVHLEIEHKDNKE